MFNVDVHMEEYRIKELMLLEVTKTSDARIRELLENIFKKHNIDVKRLGTELSKGSTVTVDSLVDNLVRKIKNGDLGDIGKGEVFNNLRYLKNSVNILKVLNDEYEKDPSKYNGLDKHLFGEAGSDEYPLDTIFSKTVDGEFCKDCMSNKDITDRLQKVVDTKKGVDELRSRNRKEEAEIKQKASSPRELDYLMNKLYGDSFGLVSFFTRGHISKSQDILDKYRLRDRGVSMGNDPEIEIEILSKRVEIPSACGKPGENIHWENGMNIKTTYSDDEGLLYHRIGRCDITITLNDRDLINGETYRDRLGKIIFHQGKTINFPGGGDVKYKVLSGGKNKVGRPKNQDS